LPMVKVFVSVLKVPQKLLLPLIVVLCLIGVYSISSSYLDLMVLAVFGIAGYAIRESGFEPAPLILALVLGPIIETSLSQSLKITRGDFSAVLFRPICLSIFLVVLLSLVAPWVIKIVKKGIRSKNQTV
jgi:putative tricarboxylic transport membrane protein